MTTIKNVRRRNGVKPTAQVAVSVIVEGVAEITINTRNMECWRDEIIQESNRQVAGEEEEQLDQLKARNAR